MARRFAVTLTRPPATGIGLLLPYGLETAPISVRPDLLRHRRLSLVDENVWTVDSGGFLWYSPYLNEWIDVPPRAMTAAPQFPLADGPQRTPPMGLEL